MTHFSEELREVIEELLTHSGCYVKLPAHQQRIDQAISAITELVKRIVPKAKARKIYFGENCTSDKNKGFNSCRTEMLKKLE